MKSYYKDLIRNSIARRLQVVGNEYIYPGTQCRTTAESLAEDICQAIDSVSSARFRKAMGETEPGKSIVEIGSEFASPRDYKRDARNQLREEAYKSWYEAIE